MLNRPTAASKRRPALFLLAFILFLGLHPILSHAEKLTLVANEWPPFTGDSLTNKGYATEIVQTIFQKAGYETEVLILPWDEAYDGVVSGKYDVIIAAWYSESRVEVVDYTLSYLSNRIRFLKRNDSDIAFDSLAGLSRYKIGIIPGYAYSDEFNTNDSLNRIPGDSFIDNVRKLVDGEIDLTLEDELVGRYLLSQQDPALANAVQFMHPPLVQNPTHAAISKARPDHAKVVEDFNKAAALFLKEDGLNEIRRRHGF